MRIVIIHLVVSFLSLSIINNFCFYLDILTLEGEVVVQNRDYQDTYNDSNSPDFMEFAVEVEQSVSD